MALRCARRRYASWQSAAAAVDRHPQPVDSVFCPSCKGWHLHPRKAAA